MADSGTMFHRMLQAARGLESERIQGVWYIYLVVWSILQDKYNIRYVSTKNNKNHSINTIRNPKKGSMAYKGEGLLKKKIRTLNDKSIAHLNAYYFKTLTHIKREKKQRDRESAFKYDKTYKSNQAMRDSIDIVKKNSNNKNNKQIR